MLLSLSDPYKIMRGVYLDGNDIYNMRQKGIRDVGRYKECMNESVTRNTIVQCISLFHSLET